MAERTSIFTRGETSFSQTRETVSGEAGPDVRLVSSEGDRLVAEALGAKEALVLANEFGDQSIIDRAQEHYDHTVDVLTEWENAGDDRFPMGDIDLDYFPLSDAIRQGVRGELTPEQQAQRLDDWNVFCRFVFQDGIKSPWGAFKNFLAVIRRVNPGLLGDVTATELAQVLGETKAATSAREIAFFEDACKRLGVSGFHGLGGTKSEKARRRSRKAAEGNTNRRTGTRKKKQAAKRKEIPTK
jgi:hypothetical protein